MKITEYIQELENIMKENGDLEVETEKRGERRIVKKPVIAYECIGSNSSSRPRGKFWSILYDKPELKGYKIVRLN